MQKMNRGEARENAVPMQRKSALPKVHPFEGLGAGRFLNSLSTRAGNRAVTQLVQDLNGGPRSLSTHVQRQNFGKEATLTVDVVDSNGTKVPGAVVRASSFVMVGGAKATTDNSGQCVLKGLSAGPWTLTGSFEAANGKGTATSVFSTSGQAQRTTLKSDAVSAQLVLKPDAPDFWEELTQSARQRMNYWINHQYLGAVNDLLTYITADDTKKKGVSKPVWWVLASSALSLYKPIAVPLKIASTAVTVAVSVDKLLPKQEMPIADFVVEARQAGREIARTVKDNEHPLMKYIIQLGNNPEVKDDPAERVKAERYVREHVRVSDLPGKGLISRNGYLGQLTTDWIKSAKDTDSFSKDYGGDQAGYVYTLVDVDGRWGSVKPELKGTYLDDVENKGALKALTDAYGGGASAWALPLEQKGLLVWRPNGARDWRTQYKFLMRGDLNTKTFKASLVATAIGEKDRQRRYYLERPNASRAALIFNDLAKAVQVKDIKLE